MNEENNQTKLNVEEDFKQEVLRWMEAHNKTVDNSPVTTEALWHIIYDMKEDNERLCKRLMQLGAKDFLNYLEFEEETRTKIIKELKVDYERAQKAQRAAEILHHKLNKAIIEADKAYSIGQIVKIIRDLHSELKLSEKDIFEAEIEEWKEFHNED